MASTTNNSGISGDVEDLGPDEKWDDETEEQYRIRMEKKKLAKEKHDEWLKTRMPPCIG